MSNREGHQGTSNLFRVLPEHCPRTAKEKYKRLHFYVSKLGVAVSDFLIESLLNLRSSAHLYQDAQIQQLALKGYNDEEYTSSVKELLCIWLHLEAMDQGGDAMPDWLLRFLRLAFGATDILIPRPRAQQVLNSYGHCADEESLITESALRAGHALGFGETATIFAPNLSPILSDTGKVRQTILQEALALPLEKVTKLPIC